MALSNTVSSLENTRVVGVTRLVSPSQIKSDIPGDSGVFDVVSRGRDTISRILRGEDRRFLAIVGPCSIHDPVGALEYAGRLVELRKELDPSLYIVMRVYFEKPRTTVGWKGLINDPRMDDSCDVTAGLHTARQLLLDINRMGLPVATEFLDPILPQYTADLVSWAAIGARTTESQTHREMASGLSMPVGFKNGTDGRVQTAVDALQAAGRSHSFLGIDQQGTTSVVKTAGNPDCHLVLRGGILGPNYQASQITEAIAQLKTSGVKNAIMVDCSHANSSKNPFKQVEVWNDVVEQRRAGCDSIIGAMIESYLKSGNQPLKDPATLEYGVSITDACLGWEETAELLRQFPGIT
ncbi:MAG TPA: 3-deoxy-7-phosphoheptulonate synthase [Kiritimatiellia bacterium]|nr:3-deoxy-7-phosphoheptulonate synthase [Kiritimatiellia bacterium]